MKELFIVLGAFFTVVVFYISHQDSVFRSLYTSESRELVIKRIASVHRLQLDLDLILCTGTPLKPGPSPVRSPTPSHEAIHPTHENFIPFSFQKFSDECASVCKWDRSQTTDKTHGLIGPLMFREMSDYMLGWPLEHFGENGKIDFAHPSQTSKCLLPGSIVYAKTDSGGSVFCDQMLSSMQVPFVYVTGQSDASSRWACGDRILSHPNLIRWYAQNPDIQHPKLEPIPIGLNLHENGREMETVLSESFDAAIPIYKRQLNDSHPLALANFGTTSNPGVREPLKSVLCDSEHKDWVVCDFETYNTQPYQGNPHLLDLYPKWRQLPFWFCPTGGGLDTHRLWEALYLGSIPIVERSLLDPLWEDGDLPVMVVDSLKDVKKQDLLRFWNEEWMEKSYPKKKLTEKYWKERIERSVYSVLNEMTIRESKRCWGRKQ